jgi:predicted TIM-barrel fold metal-dependent hydrolase
MRIDAHQHFWDISRFQCPWMPGVTCRCAQENEALDLEQFEKPSPPHPARRETLSLRQVCGWLVG